MKIGRVERNTEISLNKQLADLRKQYRAFQYLYCDRSGCKTTIVFIYEEAEQ